ncbi:hypothetical protein ADEAN_000664000 [Angomonas deanei]|uniref:Uncharacterized protein n=1 Tax=Angomonas deanei TaxID=59799 RepID=A0A7G2CJB6_9TRYP|nr:hypothetical protein ADEAN_000664000 [Angomonas deanei]
MTDHTNYVANLPLRRRCLYLVDPLFMKPLLESGDATFTVVKSYMDQNTLVTLKKEEVTVDREANPSVLAAIEKLHRVVSSSTKSNFTEWETAVEDLLLFLDGQGRTLHTLDSPLARAVEELLQQLVVLFYSKGGDYYRHHQLTKQGTGTATATVRKQSWGIAGEVEEEVLSLYQ